MLDRNGNGLIDNGDELFGVDSTLSNGQKAANGFAALADFDSNGDGQFDNADAQYAKVRLWRDLDQDDVSDESELSSLAEVSIASINLASSVASTATGSYIRADGTTRRLAAQATATSTKTPSIGNSPTLSR